MSSLSAELHRVEHVVQLWWSDSGGGTSNTTSRSAPCGRRADAFVFHWRLSCAHRSLASSRLATVLVTGFELFLALVAIAMVRPTASVVLGRFLLGLLLRPATRNARWRGWKRKDQMKFLSAVYSDLNVRGVVFRHGLWSRRLCQMASIEKFTSGLHTAAR